MWLINVIQSQPFILIPIALVLFGIISEIVRSFKMNLLAKKLGLKYKYLINLMDYIFSRNKNYISGLFQNQLIEIHDHCANWYSSDGFFRRTIVKINNENIDTTAIIPHSIFGLSYLSANQIKDFLTGEVNIQKRDIGGEILKAIILGIIIFCFIVIILILLLSFF